jgi:glycosyltransferase involved in cell wall biosynthesis
VNRASVLQIGKFYPPHMGGIETHLEALCRQLLGAFDVRVIASNHERGSRSEVRHGIPVIRLPTPFSITSAPVNPALASAIRNQNPDIVHIHLPHPGGVLGLLASGYRGPTVVTYHSDVVRQKIMSGIFAPFLHRVLGRARLIIATSANYIDSSPVLPRYRDRCRVVPYGIPLPASEADGRAKAAAVRARYGPRLVLAVGRFVYYKGFEFAIRAMRRLDAHLLLVGDGPLRNALEREVQECGVRSKVTFLGEIQNEEMMPLFAAADVFILPSIARSEAFGIVQLEAMAAGTPVVNTHLDSGVPWVSQHGITGLTVPARDADALARAVTTLLDDEPLRTRFGAAGRERVGREFTAEVMGRRIAAIYEEVLA